MRVAHCSLRKLHSTGHDRYYQSIGQNSDPSARVKGPYVRNIYSKNGVVVLRPVIKQPRPRNIMTHVGVALTWSFFYF